MVTYNRNINFINDYFNNGYIFLMEISALLSCFHLFYAKIENKYK